MSNDTNASTSGSTTGDVDYKALYESTEKRRADAQSALTPVQQENAELKAKLAVSSSTLQALPAEEQTRLDDLKYSDPDAWRIEINKSEALHKQSTAEQVETKKNEILAESSQAEIKQQTLSFFAAIPEIDPKVVIDSMPKKLQEQFDAGELTLNAYLQKGVDLVKGASVASVLAPTDPDLGKVAGSNAPTNEAKVAQSKQDWGTAVI